MPRGLSDTYLDRTSRQWLEHWNNHSMSLQVLFHSRVYPCIPPDIISVPTSHMDCSGIRRREPKVPPTQNHPPSSRTCIGTTTATVISFAAVVSVWCLVVGTGYRSAPTGPNQPSAALMTMGGLLVFWNVTTLLRLSQPRSDAPSPSGSAPPCGIMTVSTPRPCDEDPDVEIRWCRGIARCRCGRPYTYTCLGGALLLAPVLLAASLTTLTGHSSGEQLVSTSFVLVLVGIGTLWFFTGMAWASHRMHGLSVVNTAGGLWGHSVHVSRWSGALDVLAILTAVAGASVLAAALSLWPSQRAIVIETIWGWMVVLVAVGLMSFHRPVMIQSWMMNAYAIGALVLSFSSIRWFVPLTDPSEILWFALVHGLMVVYTLCDAAVAEPAANYCPWAWGSFRSATHYWMVLGTFLATMVWG